MAEITNFATQYFKRFQNFYNNYSLAHDPLPSLKVAVIIPAYAEDLSNTLQSLSECELPEPQKAEVILVINQPKGEELHRSLHNKQFEEWQVKILPNGLKVQAIAAMDLPEKRAGVGLARKIGMDVALERFAQIGHDGFLVCLDADCTVSSNYLTELLALERNPKIMGLSLQYRHLYEDMAPSPRKRIVNYEIWLRYYHEALRWCGYKHYFQTVGSSMLCRASAYASAGGMNKRKAGEDFYFLHKLMPLGGFGGCNSAQVFPSARVSTRVPFGTGRAMLEQEEGKKDFQGFYNPAIFEELQALHWHLQALYTPENNLQVWRQFLQDHPKLKSSFEQLMQRSTSFEKFEKNFWHWWNGFTVLKFVHYRSQTYPLTHSSEAFKFLIKTPLQGEDLLLALRRLENERGSLYF